MHMHNIWVGARDFDTYLTCRLDVDDGSDKKITFTSGPTARKQPGQGFFYFSSQLILQFTEGVQWFYYRQNFTFPRIQRGSNIFQGGGGGGGSNFFQGGNANNLWFSRGWGYRPSIPPSGSAHGHVRRYRHLRICNEYKLIQTLVAAHKQLVSAQPYCQWNIVNCIVILLHCIKLHRTKNRHTAGYQKSKYTRKNA